MGRPLPVLGAGGVPGRHPAAGLRFAHASIIAPAGPARLSGGTLIPPADIRVGSGIFPIPARGAADHAGGMDTTTADVKAQAIDQSTPHPLTRPVNDRMVAGV